MTADAKVGLLLGLVFIVIIAFLVNGLPNFFRGGEVSAAIDTSVTEPPMDNLILQSPVAETFTHQQPDVPIRRVPEPTEEVVVQLPPIPDQTVMEEAARATREVVPAAVAEKRITRHQVKHGEYLATIASLVYGPEVGKKKSTIDAIVKANKLKSPDVLQVGQVLVMPDLDAAPAAENAQPETALGNLAEKFEEVIEIVKHKKKALAEASKPAPEPQPAPPQPEYVEYVVKKNECLSELSRKQLGTYKRMDEIIKLNSDRIRNADDITVGMVLKLPKR